MRQLIDKIKNNKKQIFAFCGLFLFVLLVAANPALAADSAEGNAITRFIAWILSGINYVAGNILVFLISMLVKVATYNDFIISAPVTTGWVIIRDICNMFFILAFLVIAFATILRVDQYSGKKQIFKLLFAAVLINFSKTIFGLAIDFSQVIMLTFVNGFSQNGEAQFINMFQVKNYLAFESCDITSGESSINSAILLGAFAGTIALVITLICVIVMLAILVMRIVYIWILVIMSPLAFFLEALPFKGGLSNTIISDFTKQLVTGPILAFFIWLALVVGTAGGNKLLTSGKSIDDTKFKSAVKPPCGGTTLFTDGPFQNYIVVIALLMGGLMMAQKAGGAGASMAGKGMSWAKTAAGAGVAAGAGAWAVKKAKEKAQDVSGYSAAKQYMANRKALSDGARTDKINERANWLATKVGGAKVATVGMVGKAASDGWYNLSGKKKLDIEKKQLNQEKDTLSDLKKGTGLLYRNNVEGELKKNGTTIGGKFYQNRRNGKWYDGVNEVDESVIRQGLVEKEQGVLEASIASREKTVKKLDDRQKAAKEVAQGGMIAAAGLVGVLTGGLGLAGIAAGKLTYDALNGAKDAGKTDGKLASKFRSEQTSKKREGMKNDSNDEIRSILDDNSKSGFERLAAFEEAVSRKMITSASEVNGYREMLQKNKDLGGANKKDIEDGKDVKRFADSKINSRFNSSANDKFIGATEDYHKAVGGDPEAQYKFERMYAEGDIDIKKTDIETLSNTIKQLADGISKGKFVRDYKDMDKSRQDALIRALSANATLNANKLIAAVKDVDRAFGKGLATAGSDKYDYIRGMTEEDWIEVINKGSAEATKAIKDSVGTNFGTLADNIQTSNSKRAVEIKKWLGFTTP